MDRERAIVEMQYELLVATKCVGKEATIPGEKLSAWLAALSPPAKVLPDCEGWWWEWWDRENKWLAEPQYVHFHKGKYWVETPSQDYECQPGKWVQATPPPPAGEQGEADKLCPKCGIGFMLPSGRCDHCNVRMELGTKPSRAWLEKMADAEDRVGSISVGGLAVEMGLPVSPPTPASQPDESWFDKLTAGKLAVENPTAHASQTALDVDAYNSLANAIIPILENYGIKNVIHPATKIADLCKSALTAATAELTAEIAQLKAALAAKEKST